MHAEHNWNRLFPQKKEKKKEVHKGDVMENPRSIC